ncbi:MAG: hypothetical protein AAFN41_07145, partial [Planctomycetota bacterium]
APPEQELARGRRGPIVIATTDGWTRRIGVSFEPAESTWPIEIGFPLFVAQAIESLAAPSDASGGSIATGASPRVRLPSDADPVLRGPTELVGRWLEPETSSGTRLAAFESVPLAGEYTTLGGEPVLGVNMLSAEESSIAVSDRVSIGGRPVASLEAMEGRREIWPWLVLAAAALLTIDWLVFTFKSRA